MPNRLAQESSPYLLQHAENPVDWLPWGDEALSRARSEAKPIFLSVGYSSCHWCHVMAHESFEDLEVASLLNRGFVNVKVDREERPDVDEAYMTAVQLQSGRGGWPMSAFLTPEKAPFFAGTYFPKPSFINLLRQVEVAWSTNREQVMAAAADLREAVESAQSRPAPMSGRKLDQAFLGGALKAIAEDFDPRQGGFGTAPKFPPHGTLLFLNAVRQSPEFGDVCHTAETMFYSTLQRMVRGGIHDHIGGGFHRYSTDSQWLLPHFEKMLYDNVLMLLHLSSAVDVPEFAAASKGIVRWLKDEMLTDDGLLGTALDADSDGEEGKFYVWTMDELRAVLGTRAESFAAAYRFEPDGNYRDEAKHDKTGANIPHLSLDSPWAFAEELGLLRQARAERPRPLFDHKALLGLNGLAVAALVQAGERDFAESLFARLANSIPSGGPIPRQITAGRAAGLGFFEDYSGLLFAWCMLEKGAMEEFESRFGPREPFRDARAGDYFNTTSDHETLLGRTKSVFDQPVPSANALLALALNRLGHREEAHQIVAANLGWIERAPGSTATLLLAGMGAMPSLGS